LNFRVLVECHAGQPESARPLRRLDGVLEASPMWRPPPCAMAAPPCGA